MTLLRFFAFASVPLGVLAGMAFVFFANELLYAYAAFATVISLQIAACLLVVFAEYRGFPVSDDGAIRHKEIP